PVTRPYTMAPGPVPTAPPEVTAISVPIPTPPAPISSPQVQPFPPYGDDRDRLEFTDGVGSRPAGDGPPPGSRASWPLAGGATRDSTPMRDSTPEPRTYGSPTAEARTETIRMPEPHTGGFPRIDNASSFTADVTGDIAGAGGRRRGADVSRQREG